MALPEAKRRKATFALAAFAMLVFFAFLLFTRQDPYDLPRYARQLQDLEDELQKMLRVEIASTTLVQKQALKLQQLQQQNREAELKTADLGPPPSLEHFSAHKLIDTYRKGSQRAGSTRRVEGPPPRPKASSSKAKTGNFQRKWAPAEKMPLPPIYHPLPQAVTDSFDQTCSQYRQRVPYKKRMLGVAGLFNSGTNLLAALLDYNCNFADRPANVDGGSLDWRGPVLYQVPYGKHHPSSWWGKTDDRTRFNKGQWTNSGGKLDVADMLPVVMVKDPLTWMGSMCRKRYDAGGEWYKQENCPSLANPAQSNVDVKWNFEHWKTSNHTAYASMVDFWSTWLDDYERVPGGAIFVRFEDLLYNAAATVEPICKCAGGTVTHPIHIMTDNVKTLSNKGSKSTAQRYADSDDRSGRYSRQNLDFVRDHPLGKRVMDKFGYFVEPHDAHRYKLT